MEGSGGAGGSSGDPCGAGSTAEIQDDFNDNMRKAEWTPFGDGLTNVASEMNSELYITTSGLLNSQAGYYWGGAARSLLGCHVSIEVKQVPLQSFGFATFFELLDDAFLGKLSIALLKGTLRPGYRIGATTFDAPPVSYDPSIHRFWRFRESKGTVFFEVSADGKSWQSLFSVPTPAFASKVHVKLSMSVQEASLSGGTAILDNLNIAPP
jgi:hypothetical protein